MSDEGGTGEPLSDSQKREIAVWFLSNAPAGEIHYVAKGKPHAPLPSLRSLFAFVIQLGI
jgi:hypothetical protein